MNLSMINPYIRMARPSVLPAQFELKQRIIFDYELIYIADGSFLLHYGGQDYPCNAGQFLFLRPGISHSFTGITSPVSQPHIHFDMTHTADSPEVPVSFKDLDAMTEHEKKQIRTDLFCTHPLSPFITFSDPTQALALFEEIVTPLALSPLTAKAKLILLLEMLITDNFPELLTKQASSYRPEQHLKDYIDAGQGLSSALDDLARQFNYSKYYLERCFKDTYGIGIMAYRNEKRMQIAKELLQNHNVSSVSEQLGFTSIYVFSRAFKNFFGISPSEYRKLVLISVHVSTFLDI